MLRRRPPSTGSETPRIAPAAGEARNAITEAVSKGSINRSIELGSSNRYESLRWIGLFVHEWIEPNYPNVPYL